MNKIMYALIVVVIVAFFYMVFNGNKRGYTSYDYKVYAWGHMKSCVKSKLKSPSSAEFERFGENIYSIKELSEQGSFPKRYEINSTVESKNSFGVMIASRFSCKVSITRDGVMTCESVVIE